MSRSRFVIGSRFNRGSFQLHALEILLHVLRHLRGYPRYKVNNRQRAPPFTVATGSGLDNRNQQGLWTRDWRLDSETRRNRVMRRDEPLRSGSHDLGHIIIIPSAWDKGRTQLWGSHFAGTFGFAVCREGSQMSARGTNKVVGYKAEKLTAAGALEVSGAAVQELRRNPSFSVC